MSNLTILNTKIRKLNNLYSLNDLHRVSGNENRHRPSIFMSNQQTKNLIAEITSQIPNLITGLSQSKNSCFSHKIIKGGSDLSIRGTWVCEELAIAYATWISPKFHLLVLRAFMAMYKGQGQAQPQLPASHPPKFCVNADEQEIKDLINGYFVSTRLQECVYHILQSLKGFDSRHKRSLEFNYEVYERYIKQNQPFIRKLIEALPDNRKKTKQLSYDF